MVDLANPDLADPNLADPDLARGPVDTGGGTPAIDVKSEVIKFTTRGTTGVQSIPTSFQARGARLYWTAVTDELANNAISYGFGMTDGTNQAAFASAISDSEPDGWRRNPTNAVLQILDPTAISTVAVQAAISAFNADSIDLNYSVADGSAYHVTMVVMGGADYEAVVGTADSSGGSVTGLGLSGVPAVHAGFIGKFNDDSDNESQLSIGVCDPSLGQWSYGQYMFASTGDRKGWLNSGTFVTKPEGGDEMTIDSITASGFTWTGSIAGDLAYMAEYYGGLNSTADVVTKTTNDVNGNVQSLPSLGWSPQSMMLCSDGETAAPANLTDNNDPELSLGVVDDALSQAAIAWQGEDAATEGYQQRVDLDKAVGIVDASAAYVALGEVTSMGDPAQITWNPSDMSAYRIGRFAIGRTLSQPVQDRGVLEGSGGKYVWSNTGRAFVPKYAMIGDNSGIDLSTVTQASIDAFLDEYFDNHGFNGVHVPVYGQWFHIGVFDVASSDSAIDQATFDKLIMIIETVYDRGGHVHMWQWGDSARGWTSAQLSDGIMGATEQALLDEIYSQLNPINGWSMGYGFDCWEWVSEAQLQSWHDYLNAKPNFRHLIGARAQKNEINQIYQGTTNWYNGYEQHEPDYTTLTQTADHADPFPAHSEDRFRMRDGGAGKDYTADQTRLHLWRTTMAGGVAGIYGNIESGGDVEPYPNAAELKTHETFFHTTPRFRAGMVRDNAVVTGGVALRESDTHYVYFVEGTGAQIDFSFAGADKQAIAVDAGAAYSEIDLGTLTAGANSWTPPHSSDWAIAVGDF